MIVLMIDPAMGWKYGFPKEYINHDGIPVKEWLIQNGYPKQLAEKEYPYRMWEKEYKDESSG